MKKTLVGILLLWSFAVGAQELPKLTVEQVLNLAVEFAGGDKEFVGACKNYYYDIEYSSRWQQWEVTFDTQPDPKTGLVPYICDLIVIKLDKDGNLIERQ